MLEWQHTQLVSCVQERYQRLRAAGLWGKLPTDGSDKHFLVHDILTTLNLLKPKSDGSGELKTFNDVGRSSPPGHDVASQGSDRIQDAREQHKGDISRRESLRPPWNNNISVFPETPVSDCFRASSMSMPPLYQSF
jgi:hypothetical protein